MKQEEETKTEGAILLEKISAFIKRFAFLPSDEAALVIALFVVHTWAIDAAEATPYLLLASPEKRSGKTRLLEVLGLMVRNPIMGASLSDSSVFRMVEALHPTLMIDEMDAVFHGAKNEAMRGVLNSGYRRSGHVWRVVKNDPTRFSTFCCKLLAGINNGNLPDTIRDRAIPIRMRRKPKEVEVEPFYLREIQGCDELEEILNGIEKWVACNISSLYGAREPIAEINDRQFEISEPLVAIAERMGIGPEAREALTVLFHESEEQQGPNPAQELLLSIKAAFEQDHLSKISTRDLLERLNKAGYGNMSGKQLAVLLSPYGVQPKQMRSGNTVSRGYDKSEFDPIFESYL